MNIAEQLSQYALSIKYEDFNEKVIHKAKQRLVDSIGCALGAFDREPVSIARHYSESVPVPLSTILGTQHKTTPDVAAFVNGTMVRHFDFNDGYISKELGHPSDNIPACMAVAEAEGASGKDLLLSIILAYEIQCRLQDAANLYRRGWDHVNYVLISSSVAAGRLMRLTQAQLTQAINIALNGHIAMRQVRAGELSAWKGSSAANAARNGIFAAMLARFGMNGPSPIFEGEMGFFKQITGEFSIDAQQFGSGSNGDFRILMTGVKMLPTQGEMHTAVYAALALRKEIEDLSDIVSVIIETTEVGYKILGKDPEKWRPATRETADHSLPYTIARALVDGEISVDTYTNEKIHDPGIIEFMKMISVHEDKTLTDLFPKFIPNRVTVKLSTGKILSRQVNGWRDVRSTPIKDEDFENKFDKLTEKYFSVNKRKSLLQYLWNIDGYKELSGLFKLLVIDKIE